MRNILIIDSSLGGLLRKMRQYLTNFDTLIEGGEKRGEVKLKEYECVKVEHHKDVSKTIEGFQRNGWRLHTYQTAGMGAGPMAYTVYHYLLFEKGE